MKIILFTGIIWGTAAWAAAMPEITIRNVDFAGDCGSPEAGVTDGHLRVVFDDMEAVGSEANPVDYRFCAMKAQVDLPDGWTMAPTGVQVKGVQDLPAGAAALLRTTYSMNGLNFMMKEWEFTDAGTRPFDVRKESMDMTEFDQCGGTRVFSGTIELRVVYEEDRSDLAPQAAGFAGISIGNALSDGEAIWEWEYRKCRDPDAPVNHFLGRTWQGRYTNPSGQWINHSLNLGETEGTYSVASRFGRTERGWLDQLEWSEDRRRVRAHWHFGSPNDEGGWVDLRMNADNRSFNGTWGFHDDPDKVEGLWQGSR